MNAAITSPGRAQMKVYAARDYIDDTYRRDNYVEVNLPEYLPTTPQDDEEVELELPKSKDYFFNNNYPVVEEIVKIRHYLKLPIYKGTFAPVRFRKGAEFLLVYPTGKIEAGFLIFIQDKPTEGDES